MKKLFSFLLSLLLLSSTAFGQNAWSPRSIGPAGGTFTGPVTFNDDVQARWGTGLDFACEYDTAQTPDAMVCGVSSDSRNWIITEKADINTDYAHALSTNPTLFIQSSDQTSVNDFISLSHDQTDAVINVGTGSGLLFNINGSTQMGMHTNGDVYFGTDAANVQKVRVADTTTITNGVRAGLAFAETINPGAASTASYYGVFGITSNFGSTGDISGDYYGLSGTGQQNATGTTLTRASGLNGSGRVTRGTVTMLSGVRGGIVTDAGFGGVATTAAAFYAPAITGTLAPATSYGLLIDPPGVGTIQWTAGIGTGNSYVAGSLSVGKSTAPTETLDVSGDLAVSQRTHSSSATVASANDLTLGTANQNIVTGNTQINAIITSDWVAGDKVTLIFSGAPTVKHNTAGGAGTAVLLLSGSADFVAAANSVLGLEYDGTQWQETFRKAP